MENRSEFGATSEVNESVTAIVTCMTDAERPYIDEAIDSVLSQTCTCEIIVILSESSNLFDELDKKYPSVRFIRTIVRPPGETRNFGVQQSRTLWVAFLDGDDIWYATKLEEQLKVAKNYNADLVGCDHYLLSEDSRPCACSLSHNIPMTSSWFVKRSVMVEKPFSSLLVAEDGVWWVENTPVLEVVRVPKFLIGYRVRGVSQSNRTPSKRRKWLAIKCASFPIVRQTMFSITWLFNFYGKSIRYRWLKKWQ